MLLPIARKNLFYFLYLCVIVCLLYSKFILSVCSITLLVLSLFTYEKEQKLAIGLHPALTNWKVFSRQAVHFLGFFMLYLWMLFSYFWSNDTSTFQHEMISNLSYAGIPIILVLGPKLNVREIFRIHLFFYLILSMSCLLVAILYLFNFEYINHILGLGQAIPTPIDHIRFSLMIAYAALSALAFTIQRFQHFNVQKIYLFIVAIFFSIILHFLAVRSGLLVLYTGFFISILYFIRMKKLWLQGAFFLLLLFIIPFIAYKSLPSLQAKLEYSKYDLELYLDGSGDHYSDSQRIRSIQHGWVLWKKNFILGLGAGDFQFESDQLYESQDYTSTKLLPHNQWIRTGMAYGIIGVILLILALFYPFKDKNQRTNLVLVMLIQIYFFSFIVESNFERYYSLSFFLFFFGWNLMLIKPSTKAIDI